MPKISWLVLVGVVSVLCACGKQQSTEPATANETAPHDTAATSATAPVAAAAAMDVEALPADQRVASTGGSAPDGMVFNSVLDLKQRSGGFRPQLRGGMVANSADWPASFFATFSTPEGTFSCTSTLVGPSALLTAAHCVPPSGIVQIKSDSGTYEANCEQHDRYSGANPDASADFGLCKLKREFVQPVGFRFESIEILPGVDLVGRTVLLTGYGCRSDVVAQNDIDGSYRIGTATIVENSSSKTQTYGADFYNPKERNNLFTANDGANLCPGDSGGPAFRITQGQEPGAQYPNRIVTGVNSRVFYNDQARKTYGASLVSATSGPSFPTWARKWANRNSVAICGVAGATPNCRGGGG